MDQHGEHLQRQGNVILISSSLGFVPAGQALQRFLQFRNKWISTIGDALFSHRLSIRISSKDTGSAPQDSDEYLQ